MKNGPELAAFWEDFILAKSGYPAPDRPRQQFEAAEFTDLCDGAGISSGLNGAAVCAVRPRLPANSRSSDGHWSIYEADFRLSDDKTLEIIIFADQNGNLAYVEVDCCANSYPVPDRIEVEDAPFHTRSADGLLS